MERRRNLGLASGSLILTVAGALWAAIALFFVRSVFTTAMLTSICVMAAILIACGVALIRTVRRLPDTTSTDREKMRTIARRFYAIVAAEWIAIAIVTLTCLMIRRPAFIVPLILIVIGLHFLPLARLFDVPRYTVTGALLCGIPILTMLAIPRFAYIGHAPSWAVVPSVSCALVAWLTAAAGFHEVRQFVSRSQAV